MIKTVLGKLGIGSGNNNDNDSTTVPEEELQNANSYFAPEDIVWFKDKAVTNGKHTRTYAIDGWPRNPRDNMLISILMDSTVDYDFNLHFDPYQNDEAVNELDDIEEKLNDKRTGAFAEFSANKTALQDSEEDAKTMKNMVNKGQKLFDVAFFLTIYADDKDELEDVHRGITNTFVQDIGVSVSECTLRQKEAMQSASPIGKDALRDKTDEYTQRMLGSSAAKTFPFIDDTFMEESGVMFGLNEESNTPVIVDVFNRRNGYNMLTSGMIGSGKSFSSSQVLMAMDAAYPNFKQFIIDPMGGFQGVNHCLDGERIILNGQTNLNPMKIKETPEEVMKRTEGQLQPYNMKLNELKWFFTQFFESIGGSNESLSNEEINTLGTAITRTYSDFGITQDISTHSKESPTISDLIETLEEMATHSGEYANTDLESEIEKREEIAVDLLLAMEPFREGGEYHNLAQESDIDITDERTVYLDLSQIPNNSDDMGVMMKLLFMQMYQEAKQCDEKVAITIDEAHKIMRDDGMTSGLEEMFRHSRHFDMSINLISQTSEEFYATETGETIAKQCSIKRFHRVDDLDQDLAESSLDLNQNEIDFIESAEPGEGEKDYSQALLQISDEDRSIPLRIEATRDEAMVIDYEADEDVDDYNSPEAQSLKNAMDMKNRTETPVYVGEDDELATRIAGQLAKSEQNKDMYIDYYTDEGEGEDVTTGTPVVENEYNNNAGGNTTGQVNESGNSATDGSNHSDSDSGSDSESDSEYANLKRRIGSASDVEELSENQVELICTKYGIGNDDDSDVLRSLIKREVFNEAVTIPGENDISSTNDEDSDSNETREDTPSNSDEQDSDGNEDNGSDDESSSEDGEGSDSSSESSEETSNQQTITASAIKNMSDSDIDELYLQYIGDNPEKSTEMKRDDLVNKFE